MYWNIDWELGRVSDAVIGLESEFCKFDLSGARCDDLTGGQVTERRQNNLTGYFLCLRVSMLPCPHTPHSLYFLM